MSKRQRLDNDGRWVWQLELKLELARLCREEAEQEAAPTVDAEEGDDNEVPVVLPTPPPTPQAGTSSATPSTATRNRQQQVEPQPFVVRGRGRCCGGARGGRASPSKRGLLTVFVCLAHDKIYCQVCNVYERSDRYWDRQWCILPMNIVTWLYDCMIVTF